MSNPDTTWVDDLFWDRLETASVSLRVSCPEHTKADVEWTLRELETAVSTLRLVSRAERGNQMLAGAAYEAIGKRLQREAV